MDRQVQEAETVEDYRGEHLPGYDERDGVCCPILRIRVGQDYRSGNVEGAKHPHPGPPWCVGDVTQSRYALADQSTTAPRTSVPTRKGIAAAVIVPPTVPRSSLSTANCTGTAAPPKWRAA